MILLLFTAAIVYLVSGKIGDCIFLTTATVIVSVITIFQDSRSRNALEKLKTFSKTNAKVIRNGEIEEIKSEDIVLGDSMITDEGVMILADGIIVHSNFFFCH
jgi:Ca2+-transporting ATPase